MLSDDAIAQAGRRLAEEAAAPVMSEALVEQRRNVPGALANTALREGRLVAES